MSGPFVNKHNSQFIQPRIDSKEGVRCANKGQRGGSPYGVTMDSLAASVNDGIGKSYPEVVKHYNNCNKQKGGGYNYDANFRNPLSYGYSKADAAIAGQLKGSYAPISLNPAQTQCGAGKSRKKRKRRRKNKSRKTRRRRTRNKRRRKRRRRRKTRGGTKKTRGGAKKKCCGRFRKTRRYKRQKGGSYRQYGSGVAVTPSYSSPNTGGNLPWATGPVSHVRQINCRDNYNHFKK